VTISGKTTVFKVDGVEFKKVAHRLVKSSRRNVALGDDRLLLSVTYATLDFGRQNGQPKERSDRDRSTLKAIVRGLTNGKIVLRSSSSSAESA